MQDENRHDEDAVGGPAPAVEQFQRAALEAVKAARMMLDAAESVIRDPSAVESVVQTVSAMARSAGETVVGFAAGASGAPVPGAGDSVPDDEPDIGFERIQVD